MNWLQLEKMPKQCLYVYRVAQKIGTIFIRLNFTKYWPNQFLKLFHYQNQEKICNNTITKAPTAPQVCHDTTL